MADVVSKRSKSGAPNLSESSVVEEETASGEIEVTDDSERSTMVSVTPVRNQLTPLSTE